MKENARDISNSYAKALYRSATDESWRDQIMNDVHQLSDMLSHTTLFRDLSSPILGKFKQKELLSELSKQLNLSQITTDFLYVVVDKGRLSFLQKILQAYQKIYLEGKNIVEVEVETAVPLTEHQTKALTKGLTEKLKKEIILHQKLNERILGGLILRYQSYEIDDSLNGKVQAIEKIMKGL